MYSLYLKINAMDIHSTHAKYAYKVQKHIWLNMALYIFDHLLKSCNKLLWAFFLILLFWFSMSEWSNRNFYMFNECAQWTVHTVQCTHGIRTFCIVHTLLGPTIFSLCIVCVCEFVMFSLRSHIWFHKSIYIRFINWA